MPVKPFLILSCFTHLYFDKFLYPIHDEYMIFAIWTFPENGFIACSQPSILECLFVGSFVVKIPKDDGGPTQQELPRCVIFLNFGSVGVYQSGFELRQETSGRAKKNVMGAGMRCHRCRFGKAFFQSWLDFIRVFNSSAPIDTCNLP